MNWSSASVALTSAFNTGWCSASAVAWPGVRYAPVVGTPFVRFSMIPGESVQVSMAGAGNRGWRHTGIVIVQVFRPCYEGEKTALTWAENVAAIFRGKTISGIVLKAPTVETIGNQGDWHQVNVTIPFTFDATY